MEKQKQFSAQHRGVSRMHLRNIVGRHMGSTPYFPRWRESRVGYASSVLFVGLGFVVSFLVAQAQFPFSLPGVPLLCAVVVIALLWGIGPAAFAILLSLLALDYLAVPPFGTLGVPEWRSVLQLLTFALAGTGIAVLAHRYDAAFWRLLLAGARTTGTGTRGGAGTRTGHAVKLPSAWRRSSPLSATN